MVLKVGYDLAVCEIHNNFLKNVQLRNAIISPIGLTLVVGLQVEVRLPFFPVKLVCLRREVLVVNDHVSYQAVQVDCVSCFLGVRGMSMGVIDSCCVVGCTTEVKSTCLVVIHAFNLQLGTALFWVLGKVCMELVQRYFVRWEDQF